MTFLRKADRFTLPEEWQAQAAANCPWRNGSADINIKVGNRDVLLGNVDTGNIEA